MTTYSNTFAGAGSTRYEVPGNFFRLLDASAEVTVSYYRSGAEVAKADGVLAGYAEQFNASFDAVFVESSAAQSVKFIVRQGSSVAYDRGAASVTVTNSNGPHANSSYTVGSGAAVTLAAANAARRFLLVQNNDPAVAIRVRSDGTPPTAATGVRIVAGASLLLDVYSPTGEVQAIAESGAGCAVEVEVG